MIVAHQVNQHFGRVVALDAVSFRIERGEVVALMGPSGAGKTTLLRILATYMAPSSGTVTLDARDTVRDSLEVRRRLGYLPEREPVYPEMRVSEYLTFRARLRGIHGRARRKRIREWLSRLGLMGLESALMGRLAKGETRRVLLADCLIGEPELLLLDEPTLGLDPWNAETIRKVLATLAGERTIVMSTHDPEEAGALCGKLLLLQRGGLAAFDSPAAVARARQAGSLAAVLTGLGRGRAG
jgi:ABC-2 type transport system ATP-binding protein